MIEKRSIRMMLYIVMSVAILVFLLTSGLYKTQLVGINKAFDGGAQSFPLNINIYIYHIMIMIFIVFVAFLSYKLLKRRGAIR